MDAARWVEVLKKSGKPAPLLATLRHGKQDAIARRLAALVNYADDFAVGDAVLEIAHAPPWTSDSSKPLWGHVFSIVAQSNDPRLKEAKPEWAVRPLFKTWLTNGWKRAVAQLPTRDALTPARRKQLEAHEKAAPLKKPVGEKGTTDDALLAAIYAAPDDDAPRRVYADLLMEQGDPRGEFISLQLANADEKKQKVLLKAHGKKWLGDLAEVIAAGFEFRRGFLAKATLKFRNQADFETWGARPEWATLEEVDFAGRSTVPDGQAQFIYAITPAMKGLKRARGVERPAIVDVTAPWALESLSVALENDELRALFESKMFPKLHTLELSPERLAEAGFFKQLKGIGAVKHFVAHARLPAPAVAAASRLPFETLTLNDVVYRRDARGQLSNPDVKAPAATGFPAFEWLEGLEVLKDGSLVVVTTNEIWHVDAKGQRVLNQTSRDVSDAYSDWESTSFTSDGRVIGVGYKTITVTDAVTGKVTSLSVPGLKNLERRLSPLSDDDRFLSATGRYVIDLQKRTELKPPKGAGKAVFITPDQQCWVAFGALGKGRSRWVMHRAGAREGQPLHDEANYLHSWSFAAGRLFCETDDELISWDAATGQRLASQKGLSLRSFERGGALFTALDKGELRLCDAASMKVLASWKASHAAVSPDGKTVWVAEVKDKQLRLTAHPLKSVV